MATENNDKRKPTRSARGRSRRVKRTKHDDKDASDREDANSPGEDNEQENQECEMVETTANVGTTNTTSTVTPQRQSDTNTKDTSDRSGSNLTNPTGLTTKSSIKTKSSYNKKTMTRAEEAYRKQLNKLESVMRRVVNTEIYVNHKFIDLDFYFRNARKFVEEALVTENIPVPDGVKRADFVDNLGQIMVKVATLNKNQIQRNMKKQYWGRWTTVCVL
jgi:hypothetical protein